jgi:NAD(P)-dependent dehydrogenase (short-subunit alcohol dehydrogenase family)
MPLRKPPDQPVAADSRHHCHPLGAKVLRDGGIAEIKPSMWSPRLPHRAGQSITPTAYPLELAIMRFDLVFTMASDLNWDQLEGTALVVGQGGIGKALETMLASKAPKLQLLQAGRQGPFVLNICSEQSLDQLKKELRNREPLRLVINTAGWLHRNGMGPEKRLQSVNALGLEESFRVNAFGPILLAKAVEDALGHGKTAWFASLSARVGSIGDNQSGGWYSYRAAKAAQNQLLRTLAIEWQRRRPNVTVSLIHPGTTATNLSEPFRSTVSDANLFSPERAADQILNVIAKQTPVASGSFLAWNGQTIPW